MKTNNYMTITITVFWSGLWELHDNYNYNFFILQELCERTPSYPHLRRAADHLEQQEEPHCKPNWKVNAHATSDDACSGRPVKRGRQQRLRAQGTWDSSSARTAWWSKWHHNRDYCSKKVKSKVRSRISWRSESCWVVAEYRTWVCCCTVLHIVFSLLCAHFCNHPDTCSFGSRKCSTAMPHSHGSGAWRQWKSVPLFSRSRSPIWWLTWPRFSQNSLVWSAIRRAHGEAGDERSKDQEDRWRVGRDHRLEDTSSWGKERRYSDNQPHEIPV